MKIDLHSHSSISYDGGITAEQYVDLLAQHPDFYMAITDHNEVSLALSLHQKIGNQVIVGEEIMTADGEIIGLYLHQKIAPHLSVLDTIVEIKKQGGLVYIPHPLEKTRHGLSLELLKKIHSSIDIIEGFNARSREPWLRAATLHFAQQHNIPVASSSDAHGVTGLHTAYTNISEVPTQENLKSLLLGGNLVQQRAPLLSKLDPLKNKLLKRFL